MNQKRYWLRGGGLGIVYSVFVVIYYLISSANTEQAPLILVFLNFPSLPVFNLIEGLLPYIDETMAIAIISFPVNFIIGVILGSIIGWVYGKIKNKPQRLTWLAIIMAVIAIGGGIYYYSQYKVSTPQPSSNVDTITVVNTVEKDDQGVKIEIYEYSKYDASFANKLLNSFLGSYNRTGWKIELIKPNIYKLTKFDNSNTEVAMWYSNRFFLRVESVNLFIDGLEKEQVLEDYLTKYPSTITP